MNRIRVVLTDLGNVAVHASHIITHSYLVEDNVPYPLAKQFFTISEYFDFSRGKIDEKTLCLAENDLLQRNYSKKELQFYHDKHIYAPNLGVCALLEAVSEDIGLAVATDTNVWQTDRIEYNILKGRKIIAGTIFRSNEIRKLKSEPGIFNFYARQLNEEPSSILFIDDRADLCKLAQEAGFQTHCFRDEWVLTQELMLRGLIDL